MDEENIAQNYKQIGINAYKQKKYKEAIINFTKAIENHEDATFYSNRAACYQLTKQYDLCIKDCLKILMFDSSFIKAWTRKGQAEMSKGMIQESIESFKNGLTINSNDESLKKMMDKATLLQGYYEDLKKHCEQDNLADAIRKCDYILEDCIDSEEVQLMRLELWAKNGDLNKAKKQIETFYNEQSGLLRYNPLLGYYKGLALLYEGNEEGSKKIWQSTMVSDPELKQIPIALKNLKLSKELKEQGSNLYKNNKTKEAIEKWEESVALDKYHRKFNSLVYGNLMTAHNKLNDNSRALKAINEALRCDPNFAKGYFKRGQIYCKIEDYQEAAKDYQTAQNLDASLNLQSEIQKISQKASKQSKNKDYYSILGIKRDSTNSELTKAYRKLCLKYHPDRQDNEESKDLANKKMLDINEAYSVLKDDKKRKSYDMCGIEGANMDFSSSSAGGNPFEGFNMGGARGNGFSNMKFSSKDGSGNQIPPNIFQMFFQNGSNSTFNFDQSGSRNSKKPDNFGFGGFGDEDMGSMFEEHFDRPFRQDFEQTGFEKTANGHKQKFKYTNKMC